MTIWNTIPVLCLIISIICYICQMSTYFYSWTRDQLYSYSVILLGCAIFTASLNWIAK